jgi:TPR repeat protein
MTIHSSSARDYIKQEPPLSELSAKQKYTLSNYLTGQLPATELPIYSAPRLFTLASISTSNILKDYFGGERPSTPPQDTSDPRVFSRTHSSAVSSTHSLQASDFGDVSTSQSQSVMTSVVVSQSRDQIRKELNQNYDFLIALNAAQKGSSEAQFNLWTMYAKGRGVKKDDAQAFNWCRKAAEQGHASAQFNLGCMYAKAQGVKQDDAKAVYWYRKAAEQGHAGAQFYLGFGYTHGFGVKIDRTKAVYWYRMAAEQGHAGAQCNLGLMYGHGEGVKKDYAQALNWYRKAAGQNHAKAQIELGWMYERGQGVKKDQTQAMYWYCKAAEQGDADAQFKIGEMYAEGEGVEADDVQAFNWYFKAAKNGFREAQLKLATHYQQGPGVKKDVLQATYWLLKSVVDGTNREIFLYDFKVAEDFYSDVIQCIPDALTTFPEFEYIKSINFRNIDLSDQDFFSIGQMIRANLHLEGLNFEIQEIDDAQAMILSQSLAFNTTLTELTFDDKYGFDANIFDKIKASLAQNMVIAELREHMKNHPITRSDELPLEVLDTIVDDMIVKASKAGKNKEATITAIDEFLLSVSRETLKMI